MRTAEKERNTKETSISVKVQLDGAGRSDIKTPYGFMNHMLELLSKHSGIDMRIEAGGDTDVDAHHTVEDMGIVLGAVLSEALGDRAGIERYSSIMMPMDEARVDVAIDLGGRPNLVYELPSLEGHYDKEAGFDFSLVKEFMKALSDNLKATLHFCEKNCAPSASNRHHVAEAAFKGLARTLRAAVTVTGKDIPSTKGMI